MIDKDEIRKALQDLADKHGGIFGWEWENDDGTFEVCVAGKLKGEMPVAPLLEEDRDGK